MPELFFPVRVVVDQKVGEAKDGVQRSPDFVAHDRQEARLRLIGGFGCLLEVEEVGDVVAVQVELP